MAPVGALFLFEHFILMTEMFQIWPVRDENALTITGTQPCIALMLQCTCTCSAILVCVTGLGDSDRLCLECPPDYQVFGLANVASTQT